MLFDALFLTTYNREHPSEVFYQGWSWIFCGSPAC